MLTPRGVVVFELLFTVMGALLNTAVTGAVGWIFAVSFVLGAVVCSWLARADARAPALVTLPLAYALGLAIAIAFGAGKVSGGLFEDLASLVVLLALDPMPLFVGLALAIALVLLRPRLARRRAAARRD